MANEIYNNTWWGNTIQTASSIGTSTEMIQGQFNLTKLGSEEIINGNFSDGDTDWNIESVWSIENGVANGNGANGGSQELTQNLSVNLTVGKTYKVVYEVLNYVSGTVNFLLSGGGSFFGDIKSNNGTFTQYVNPVGNNNKLKFRGADFYGSIDNISLKEARATEVEAVKCLADAIHRIGIQDIQN
tara:strand:+ start:3367 stop:3924 length:558 start_codon:yes stop_codon:yes gene_type:complete